MARAIYPGSFDPPTLGHLSLVARGLTIFDEIVVAVAKNSAKAALFSTEERLEMLRQSIGPAEGRVTVDSFEGLLVDYAKRRGATAILRGLRATADFEYEFQMATFNRQLEPAIQSVFLMTDQHHLHISSTIVREAAALKADVTSLVPPPVAERLKKKFQFF